MYDLQPTGQFRKDLKLCQRRGYDMTSIQEVLEYLHLDGQVPVRYNPHKLTGKLKGFWECHIEPDWLLIYDVKETIKLISLVRTGTHSDLLSKK